MDQRETASQPKRNANHAARDTQGQRLDEELIADVAPTRADADGMLDNRPAPNLKPSAPASRPCAQRANSARNGRIRIGEDKHGYASGQRFRGGMSDLRQPGCCGYRHLCDRTLSIGDGYRSAARRGNVA